MVQNVNLDTSRPLLLAENVTKLSKINNEYLIKSIADLTFKIDVDELKFEKVFTKNGRQRKLLSCQFVFTHDRVKDLGISKKWDPGL